MKVMTMKNINYKITRIYRKRKTVEYMINRKLRSDGNKWFRAAAISRHKTKIKERLSSCRFRVITG